MSNTKKLPIYMDFAATTPVSTKVAKAMSGCLTIDGVFANSASRSHRYGWQAEEKVETARIQVAELLACDNREIIFTSGATEANNLALKGCFAKHQNMQLVTSSIEHKAVLDPAKYLQQCGATVRYLKPNSAGLISLEQVADAIDSKTRLVSLMWVNNEVGSINPIAEIGKLCRQKNILFHVDAVQGIGKLPLNVEQCYIDMLSLSAHKFYGPKGVGALYVRKAIHSELQPQILGGGHERGLRSGTLATHQIVGLGLAAELAVTMANSDYHSQLLALRESFWQGISDLPGVRRNSTEQAIGSHLNVCFKGIDAETLLLTMRDIAASSGSACTSASIDPSYVLTEIGLSPADALSSIRFSLGKYTTMADIEHAIAHIRQIHALLSA